MIAFNDMSNIRVFVINLPKDVKRREFMEKQLNDLRVSYEFVDGKHGSDSIVIESCDDALAIKEHGKVLTVGEKGCAFAHRSVYEKMVNEKIPYALIMEDDVILQKNFPEILEHEVMYKDRVWDWLSFDYPRIGFDFILAWLIASSKMTRRNVFFSVYALIKFPFIVALSLFEIVRSALAKIFPSYAGPKIFYRPLYNAGAYVITLEGIEKIKPLLYPLRFSADRTPNQARVKTGLIMRWYVPRVAHQDDDFGSNTIN